MKRSSSFFDSFSTPFMAESPEKKLTRTSSSIPSSPRKQKDTFDIISRDKLLRLAQIDEIFTIIIYYASDTKDNLKKFLFQNKKCYEFSQFPLAKLTNLGKICWNMANFSNFVTNYGSYILDFHVLQDFSSKINFLQIFNCCPNMNAMTLGHITLDDGWVNSISEKKALRTIRFDSMENVKESALEYMGKNLVNLQSIELTSCSFGFNESALNILAKLVQFPKLTTVTFNKYDFDNLGDIYSSNPNKDVSIKLIDCNINDEVKNFLNTTYNVVVQNTPSPHTPKKEKADPPE